MDDMGRGSHRLYAHTLVERRLRSVFFAGQQQHVIRVPRACGQNSNRYKKHATEEQLPRTEIEYRDLSTVEHAGCCGHDTHAFEAQCALVNARHIPLHTLKLNAGA